MAEDESAKLAVEPEEPKEPEAVEASPKPKRLRVKVPSLLSNLDPRKFKSFSKKHKIIYVAVILLIIAMAVPYTRYKALGLFIKKDVSVTVTDSQSGKPVTGADVKLANQTEQTNKDGVATFHSVKPGQYNATVQKKYYDDSSVKVTLFLGKVAVSTTLKANGVPIDITVNNKITGKPVPDLSVTIEAQGTITGDDGKAQVVVAPNTVEIEATISGNGYVEQKVALNAVDPSKNTFTVVPSGKIYFLSKQSGKIDVVSTNLDGSDRKTVLAGTGHEEERGTVLLASRDWKYLALQAVRDTNDKDNKIYLIDTSTNKLTTIDEGNAVFTLDGWLNDTLVYHITRNDVSFWQADKFRLKAFDASTKGITILDKSTANDHGTCYGYYNYYDTFHCYSYQEYVGVTITNDEVIFGKSVYSNYSEIEGKDGIYGIKPNGSGKHTIVEVTANSTNYISGYITYKPNEIYYQLGDNFFEYVIGGKPKEITSKVFSDNQDKYVNFVVSPNGQNTLWAESRDGKNTMFIGNLSLEDGKEIANLSELKPYGWFTESYILLSKGGSELYIMSRDGGTPLKVSDYHKPNADYNGYGYGYGGN